MHSKSKVLPTNTKFTRMSDSCRCLLMSTLQYGSLDSRYFGFVRADQVIGKVVGIFGAAEDED